VKLRVLSSWLLLFFPPCQWAAQATSNVQKFSPPTRTYIEEIGQPDHLRLVFNADVFTAMGRTKIGVIWDLSVKNASLAKSIERPALRRN